MMMPLPLDLIVNAAVPPHKQGTPGIFKETQTRLEWAWGLEYGTLEDHLYSYSDPALEAVLKDDKYVLAFHPNVTSRMFAHSDTKWDIKRPFVQELYHGAASFDYVVLHVNPAAAIPPWVLVSAVPPHLTVCTSAAKLQKHGWNVAPTTKRRHLEALFYLPITFTPSDAIPIPKPFALFQLEYVYSAWKRTFVPPNFCAGLPVPVAPVVKEEKDWEWKTMKFSSSCDTPPGRIEDNPSVYDLMEEDMSNDSYISGADNPEDYAKASLARDGYLSNGRWLKGMKRWVQSLAHGPTGDDMMVDDNDAILQGYSKEQACAVASLDLGKPDYLSRRPQRNYSVI
ncbi:hypothetical protein GGX14DRAFT_583398 [Mycena pura]|uniref:Uncharacterized protein n=1 Tax=Mycena pura TaxID=153505 RepID=A0AAD6YW07_9AGAR|nr:hypothetical protein GGX14DRAFT_583398 [Mycena pura]